MDYSKFVSHRSEKRDEDVIISCTNIEEDGSAENCIFLAGGSPNPATFPFVEFNFTIKGGKQHTVDRESLQSALQYGASNGSQGLLKQVKKLTNSYHEPPTWVNRSQILVSGSQDGLSRAFDLLINVGDIFLVQEPFYCSVKSMLAPYSPNLVAVDCDSDGIILDSLKQKLEEIKSPDINGSRGTLKCLYVNPCGSNPQGITFTTERREAVYKLACEHDFLILEDDPYCFLQFSTDELGTCFLSLDTENRVLRFDSFSKIVSSGLRLGYVTGPTALVNKLEFHIQSTICNVPGIIQVMVSDLLESWGDEGFLAQIKESKELYKNRRDRMISLAEKYLSGLCEWTTPSGGMFLWLKVLNVEDTRAMIMERGVRKGVFLLPGNIFMVDSEKPCSYVRVSYSNCTEEDMKEGVKRLAELITEEKRLVLASN